VTDAFKFLHRATGLPGGDADTDRVVICDGFPIGRVVMIEAGQQGGLWRWSCLWVGNNTSGTAATLADGLEAIKTRVTPDALQALPPAPPPWLR
jgi:hypothetical protein